MLGALRSTLVLTPVLAARDLAQAETRSCCRGSRDPVRGIRRTVSKNVPGCIWARPGHRRGVQADLTSGCPASPLSDCAIVVSLLRLNLRIPPARGRQLFRGRVIGRLL